MDAKYCEDDWALLTGRSIMKEANAQVQKRRGEWIEANTNHEASCRVAYRSCHFVKLATEANQRARTNVGRRENQGCVEHGVWCKKQSVEGSGEIDSYVRIAERQSAGEG
jgi:hypothetical protein